MSGTSHFGPGPSEKKNFVPVPARKIFDPGSGEKKILVPVLVPTAKSFRSRSRSLQKQILLPAQSKIFWSRPRSKKNILVPVPVKKKIWSPSHAHFAHLYASYYYFFKLWEEWIQILFVRNLSSCILLKTIIKNLQFIIIFQLLVASRCQWFNLFDWFKYNACDMKVF
jgi:hypothetical protein